MAKNSSGRLNWRDSFSSMGDALEHYQSVAGVGYRPPAGVPFTTVEERLEHFESLSSAKFQASSRAAIETDARELLAMDLSFDGNDPNRFLSAWESFTATVSELAPRIEPFEDITREFEQKLTGAVRAVFQAVKRAEAENIALAADVVKARDTLAQLNASLPDAAESERMRSEIKRMRDEVGAMTLKCASADQNAALLRGFLGVRGVDAEHTLPPSPEPPDASAMKARGARRAVERAPRSKTWGEQITSRS